MPRFYFDIREEERFIPDEDGQEFDGLDEAEHEAACAAAEIGRSRLPSGDERAITIEVRNEHSQRVLTVTISIEVDRVMPIPVAPLPHD